MQALGPLTATLLVASLAIDATAQTRPDFSGRWTTQPAAPEAPAAAGRGRGGRGRGRGDMGSGWGSTITITQDARTLGVEYAFFARGDLQPPMRFVYDLGGAETTHSVMMGRGIQPQRSRAAWDGDRLVITTVHQFEDPATGRPTPMEVRQTLSLASPDSLVVETFRAGVLGGPPSTVRTTYRKL